MDQTTDSVARQLALTALTTEQFNLQTARMGTIAEANGRSTLYLGTRSSAVIAIAFVGQANQLGDTFYLFALALLPPVFLLDVFSYLRLVQTAIEDMVYAVGSFRICQYFLALDPAAVALALRALLAASVPVAATTGGLAALGLAALFFGYQVRRFRRAAAVAPEVYEGEPGHAGMGRAPGPSSRVIRNSEPPPAKVATGRIGDKLIISDRSGKAQLEITVTRVEFSTGEQPSPASLLYGCACGGPRAGRRAAPDHGGAGRWSLLRRALDRQLGRIPPASRRG